MLVERVRGEGDEDRHRHRGSQYVQQLDRRDAERQRPALKIPMRGNRSKGRPRRRLDTTFTGVADEPGKPALGAAAGEARAQMARADARGGIEHGDELPGSTTDLGFGERHSRPGAHGAGQRLVQGIVEHDPLLRTPSGRGAG